MFGKLMKKRALFFSLIFAFSFLPAGAQANKNAEVKRIDAYVKTLDAFVKRNKKPQLIFADTSDYNEGSRPKWQKFASEKALEKFREKTETYTIARRFARDGRIGNAHL
jgi:hypothetical protein